MCTLAAPISPPTPPLNVAFQVYLFSLLDFNVPKPPTPPPPVKNEPCLPIIHTLLLSCSTYRLNIAHFKNQFSPLGILKSSCFFVITTRKTTTSWLQTHTRIHTLTTGLTRRHFKIVSFLFVTINQTTKTVRTQTQSLCLSDNVLVALVIWLSFLVRLVTLVWPSNTFHFFPSNVWIVEFYGPV